MATAPKALADIALAVAKDAAEIIPIVQYAALIVKQRVEESVKDFVLTLLYPPPLGSDSSSDETQKSRRERVSNKMSGRGELCVPFSKKKDLVLHGITEGSDEVVRVVHDIQ